MEPRVIVNGQSRDLGEVGGHVTLLDWLRGRGLTGSKEGCAEGECGACAVLVARPDGADRSRWTAINACLVPAAGLDGQEVVTAEGLGQPGDLHPVQRRWPTAAARSAATARRASSARWPRSTTVPTGPPTSSTPPPATATAPAPAHDPDAPGHAPDHEHGPNGFDLHALSGNLCRCTGYRPIRDAAYALGQPDADDPLCARLAQPRRRPPADQDRQRPRRLRPAAEPGRGARPAGREPRRPAGRRLDRLGRRAQHPARRAPTSASASTGSTELRGLDVGDDIIDIGAALTLTEIERGLAGSVPLLAELFPQFASRLIRNGATLGGNLGTGSPIGDTPPALLALDASLVLASRDGEREVALADYFTGYRQTVKQPGRADQDHPHPDPAGPDQRLPQDRQAPLRRHLQRRRRRSRCGSTATASVGDDQDRPRRRGRDPDPGHRRPRRP